jgi:GR25 family glycosyltransferase involved in LPS biosynthesis
MTAEGALPVATHPLPGEWPQACLSFLRGELARRTMRTQPMPNRDPPQTQKMTRARNIFEQHDPEKTPPAARSAVVAAAGIRNDPVESPAGQGSMDIAFINLDRSGDRLARFREMNRHLTQLSRIPAMEGSRFSRATLVERNILDSPMDSYTDGAIGCALSHLSLWERAFNDNKTMTVAEDDAIFHGQFEKLARGVIATLPAAWDIILWGWNFDSILLFDMLPGVSPCLGRFDQQSLRASVPVFRQAALVPGAYKLRRAFGTICYSISPQGAGRLHRHCVPIRPMDVFYPGLNSTLPNTGIDHMMNAAYPNLQAFVCFPPLVITENNHATSTTVRH